MVLGLVNYLPQLGDFLIKHQLVYPVGHTIAIDNNVVRIITTSISEAAESTLD